jgi:hypothetical protein
LYCIKTFQSSDNAANDKSKIIRETNYNITKFESWTTGKIGFDSMRGRELYVLLIVQRGSGVRPASAGLDLKLSTHPI